MYRDIPMSQRLDKIGELLAKGIYLHMKNGNKEAEAQVGKGIDKSKSKILEHVKDKNK